ncbi:CHAT domain-containing protein [Phanerochaete sordida]|uniref:CHAT domain-containing protein n=1 Tax=Phanerochaete sordida TaxID=48140 RepID=A0A9P3LEZ5_9APHY|nr:CHAT domain-containing protein [Phanerochaete sordida]
MSNAPTRHDQVLRRTLKDLGDLLVSPVLEKLHELGIEEGSRIWWCPTSVVSALPLHAAGPLAVQGSKKSKVYLPDLYVSSYTPTLSALIDARAVRDADTSCRTGILSVAPLDGTLASVDEELGVFDAFYTDANVTHAHGSACTREAVLSGLAERPGVHFACHGTLKKGRPFDSAFLLSGKQKLTLLDIVNAELHNAELAILSACHTAEHAQDSAMDEALHLAAAMQFAGFRSVVGTMWQMQDEDGPAFALSFYGELFKEQLEDVVPGTTEVGFKRSARAVCAATRELRKRKVGLERWVNYVHIGA